MNACPCGLLCGTCWTPVGPAPSWFPSLTSHVARVSALEVTDRSTVRYTQPSRSGQLSPGSLSARSQASSAAQGGTGGRGHPSYGVRDTVSSSARNLGALPGASLLHYPAPILRLAQSQRRSVVIFLSTLDICATPTAPHFPALSLEPSPFSALPEVKESGV